MELEPFDHCVSCGIADIVLFGLVVYIIQVVFFVPFWGHS